MNVKYDEYVDSSRVSDFMKYLELRLAWVDLPKNSDKQIFYFSNLSNEKLYTDQYEKIKKFRNKIFGKKKIGISTISASENFLPVKTVTYTLWKWLKVNEKYADYNTDFSYSKYNTLPEEIKTENIKRDEAQKKLDDLYKTCITNKNFSSYIKCINKYEKDYETLKKDYSWDNNDQWSYTVLTKSEAIDALTPDIDFGLFDPELAKKKDTIISDEKTDTSTGTTITTDKKSEIK
jgi:hypothetical protein